MELVEVEILTQTITSQYGTLSAGDILRTTPEFAKHLVEDASAAKYVKAKKDGEPVAQAHEEPKASKKAEEALAPEPKKPAAGSGKKAE